MSGMDRNGERPAAFDGHDRLELPVADPLVARERQDIRETGGKPVTDVEARAPLLGFRMPAVLREVRIACAREEPRRIVGGLAERIAHERGQGVRHLLP